MVLPNPTTPSDFTCLLSGLLEDFLFYSGQEQSQRLIDIAHDITLQGRITDVYDPALKWLAQSVGCGWTEVEEQSDRNQPIFMAWRP